MSYTKDILLAILLIAPITLITFVPISFNAYGQTSTHTIFQEGEGGDQRLEQLGTGGSCPIASSVTEAAGGINKIEHSDSASGGCIMTAFTWSDSFAVDELALLPKFFNDFLENFVVVFDLDAENDTDTSRTCILYELSGLGIDPRNNITAAYEAQQNRTLAMSGTIAVCNQSQTQTPQQITIGTAPYLASMAINNTFFSYGANLNNDDRSGLNRVRNEMVNKFEFTNPSSSTAWNIQEHSKFEGINVQTARARDLGEGLNLDIGNNGGQIVAFKEFLKSEVGTNDIRVDGTFLVEGSDTANNWLRIEVRDGGISMGNVTEFPDNERAIYKGAGSLGVVHLQADTVDVVQAFDLSIIPDYNNSTLPTFTVFIGVEDNSASNDISANITSFEIDSIVKHDFDTLDYVKFWNPVVSGEAATIVPQLENSYGAGLVNVTSIATTGVTGLALPSPNPVTNFKVELDNYDTFRLTWDHDVLNSTGFRIESNNGTGYEVLAVLSNPLKVSYTDANQPSKALRNLDSNKDAKGYPESTSIDYRVYAINGDSSSTAVTSPNTKTTKADYDPYWELIEHKDSTARFNHPDVDFNLAGGDTNDWLQMRDSDVLSNGDLVSMVYKSFNITKYNITSVTDFVADIETQCLDTTLCPIRTQILIMDGDFNRYNSTAWETRSALTSNMPLVTSWGAGGTIGVMGGGTVFADRNIRVSPNLTEVTSDFITAVFVFDHGVNDQAEYDIKNATITNSTTWDFTSGQINYTRNEPNVQTIFEHDQTGTLNPRNCIIPTPFADPLPASTPFRLWESVDACDRGVVSATMTPHLELITAVNSTNDWQYRELKDDSNSQGHSQWIYSSNSTGLIMNDIEPPNNRPWGVGMSALFKTFTPTSATTFFNITMEGEALAASGGIINLRVLDTVLGNDEDTGRFNNEDFETSINFPTNAGSFIDSGAVCAFSGGTCLAINEGIAVDTSSFIGIPITAMLLVEDNSLTIATELVIKNVTLNNITYDFTDGTLFPEVKDTTADRGVFRVSSVILPPAPTPSLITSANATANINDVFIQWVHNQANTTDYVISRNGTEIVSSTGLVSNYTDSTVTTDTNYIYGVKPINAPINFIQTNGTEVFTNVVLTNDIPSIPDGLAGSYINGTAISLDWNDSINGEGAPVDPSLTLGYKLYGRDLPSGNFVLIGNTNEDDLNASVQQAQMLEGAGMYVLTTNNIASGSCGTGGLDDTIPVGFAAPVELKISPSNSALNCKRVAIEWNIEAIPTDAIISNVTFSYDIDFAGVSTLPRDCEFYQMDNRPSLTTEFQNWLDVANGTEYHNTPPLVCETLNSFNNTEVNNSDILNDLQARVTNGDGWFGVGEKFRAEFRSPSNVYRSEPANVRIIVEYSAQIPVSEFVDLQNFPQEREYKVAACNDLGCSGNSTITQILAFPLSTPVLSASNNIINGINATWTNAIPTGIQNYSLFNSTDNVTFDLLATTSSGTLFFFDTPHNICYTQFYKVRANTATQNGTNSTTASGAVNCAFTTVFNTVNIENVGDTFRISGDFDFNGGNLTSLSLKENGITTDFNGTFVNYTSLGIPVNVPFEFWERTNSGSLTEYNVSAAGQSPTYDLTSSDAQTFGTREYDPFHRPAIANKIADQGNVNYTVQRFNADDSILLKVNREQVPQGETWQIECIYQTVTEALATQTTTVPAQPTIDWVGTWDNTTDTGYFNSTISGVSGGHVYVSCFNDFLLFSTTSFTNSSLALFGIEAFDLTFGSFLGLPVGVFFVILAAGMANKRTAPTWIIMLVAIAGIMSSIGFFTLDPVVWGLVLVTAMLGLFVNQKIF